MSSLPPYWLWRLVAKHGVNAVYTLLVMALIGLAVGAMWLAFLLERVLP